MRGSWLFVGSWQSIRIKVSDGVDGEMRGSNVLIINSHYLGNTKDDSLKADDVKVNLEDFKSALQKFVPSINAKDMEYFNRLKSSFS